jgi:enediyne polyketide synthase
MLGDLVTDVPPAVSVEPDGPELVAAGVNGNGVHGNGVNGNGVNGQVGESTSRAASTTLAAGRALGLPALLRHRPDGRPELAGAPAVSASHGAGLTLCVVGAGTVGCDVEPVAGRPTTAWRELLGPHTALAKLIESETGEGFDTAATRVWTAAECLQKACLPPGSPLTLTPARQDGWTVLASGALRIATLATTLRDAPDPVVFAILTSGRP